MSDQLRADAVRYQDPTAERHLRRFLRPPVQPPRVALPGGGVAPQSAVRAYAPLLNAAQQTVYIDCVNEAATDTWTAAQINARIQWQPPEQVEANGRTIRFERGYFSTEAGAPAGRDGRPAADAVVAGKE